LLFVTIVGCGIIEDSRIIGSAPASVQIVLLHAEQKPRSVKRRRVDDEWGC
jgi:hypothetical protein